MAKLRGWTRLLGVGRKSAPAGGRAAPCTARDLRPSADEAGKMVEAWYMDESPEDQRKPHRLESGRPVDLELLGQLGVFYWKLDADKYENDPELEKIRRERNYSWMDIITICKDKLPNYEEKIKMFYEEHLHLDDEIRYILDGSGYFDVRDKEDKWIRISMEKGDMITLPAGIYHRFTLDEKNYVKAMRLFVGEPVWTPYNRPADHFDAREQNLCMCGCLCFLSPGRASPVNSPESQLRPTIKLRFFLEPSLPVPSKEVAENVLTSQVLLYLL